MSRGSLPSGRRRRNVLWRPSPHTQRPSFLEDFPICPCTYRLLPRHRTRLTSQRYGALPPRTKKLYPTVMWHYISPKTSQEATSEYITRGLEAAALDRCPPGAALYSSFSSSSIFSPSWAPPFGPATSSTSFSDSSLAGAGSSATGSSSLASSAGGEAAAAAGAAGVSPPSVFTSSFTTSTVAAGPPGVAASTLPALSTTKTPRVVPLGAFFRPMAPIRVACGSQSSGYGSFCFALKVVLALGESVDRP